MNKFPSLNEQMDILQWGVKEIIPVEELVIKIDGILAGKTLDEMVSRMDRFAKEVRPLVE